MTARQTHMVLWFPPDRPVEGNTVFVRPQTPADGAADCSPPDTARKRADGALRRQSGATAGEVHQ